MTIGPMSMSGGSDVSQDPSMGGRILLEESHGMRRYALNAHRVRFGPFINRSGDPREVAVVVSVGEQGRAAMSAYGKFVVEPEEHKHFEGIVYEKSVVVDESSEYVGEDETMAERRDLKVPILKDDFSDLLVMGSNVLHVNQEGRIVLLRDAYSLNIMPINNVSQRGRIFSLEVSWHTGGRVGKWSSSAMIAANTSIERVSIFACRRSTEFWDDSFGIDVIDFKSIRGDDGSVGKRLEWLIKGSNYNYEYFEKVFELIFKHYLVYQVNEKLPCGKMPLELAVEEGLQPRVIGLLIRKGAKAGTFVTPDCMKSLAIAGDVGALAQLKAQGMKFPLENLFGRSDPRKEARSILSCLKAGVDLREIKPYLVNIVNIVFEDYIERKQREQYSKYLSRVDQAEMVGLLIDAFGVNEFAKCIPEGTVQILCEVGNMRVVEVLLEKNVQIEIGMVGAIVEGLSVKNYYLVLEDEAGVSARIVDLLYQRYNREELAEVFTQEGVCKLANHGHVATLRKLQEEGVELPLKAILDMPRRSYGRSGLGLAAVIEAGAPILEAYIPQIINFSYSSSESAEILRALVGRGAFDVLMQHTSMEKIIEKFGKRKRIDTLMFLEEQGVIFPKQELRASLQHRTPYDNTNKSMEELLGAAVQIRDIKKLEFLVKYGGDTNASVSWSHIPLLSYAVSGDNVEYDPSVVRFLLENGADVETVRGWYNRYMKYDMSNGLERKILRVVKEYLDRKDHMELEGR